jgi:N-acetylglucosaminyldiphosphoundecaprenol N-acetyl-beta-D-mannosaminyltransferase
VIASGLGPPPLREVSVWGLPMAAVTRAQAVDHVAALAAVGRPSYVITASSHYAMLSHEVPALAEVNRRAAFIVADGFPLVAASRLLGTPLPERVAGSDLIFDLCERSARDGLRVFLLGAAPGVAEEAAGRLLARYPGLVVAGTECPPFREPTAQEHQALLARLRAARPDILFVAFGQPKGELWVFENYESLGVPVCVQIGASLDFAAGRVPRAPRALQRAGLEWAFRMALEPRRLVPRYARNAVFLFGRFSRDLVGVALGRRGGGRPRTGPGGGGSAERL